MDFDNIVTCLDKNVADGSITEGVYLELMAALKEDFEYIEEVKDDKFLDLIIVYTDDPYQDRIFYNADNDQYFEYINGEFEPIDPPQSILPN